MKKLSTLFILTLLAFALNAQYVYNDYDANQNIPFLAWPNSPVTMANPHPSGINTSANVAEWVRSDWAQYDNIYTDVLPGTIDFTTGTVFSVKIYSPIACDVLFKLEGNAAPVERLQSITTPNQWVQLNFDFTGEATDVYNKLIIFPDFATFNTNTFYLDDIQGPEYGTGGGSGGTLTLPVTFDDPGAAYDLVDFGGNFSEINVDPDDAANNIVKTIKQGTAELWAGTTVGGTVGFADPIPFTATETLMGVLVWSPEVGTPVRLKVEDADNSGITCETEALTTVAMAWDTLFFNFANPAPGTAPFNPANNYNLASIFFNFGTTGAAAGEQTYYWDYMYFKGAPDPKPLTSENIQDNFENDGWGTIDEWFFQDPDMNPLQTTTDPVNSSNTVANYNRTGNFPYTNAQFILDHRIDLTERNKFEMDVYFPSSNDYSGALTTTAAIKLQNSLLGGNAWTTQTEILINVTEYDQWVTLLFDFSGVADREDYDQVVVQLGGEGHSVPGQFYFDNLYLKHVPVVTVVSPNGGEMIDQGSQFDIEWDYDYWTGFVDIELVKGDETPQLIGMNVNVADTLLTWNVFATQEPGSDYRIIITSTDNSFPSDTSDAYFTIVDVSALNANFMADSLILLEGDSTMFTDLSTGAPISWMWTFEGGTPATYQGEQPPYIHYLTGGTYDVTLEINDGITTSTLTMEDYITVGTVPVADFMADQTSILTGQTIDFTNLSTGDDLTYSWYFEGGIPEMSSDEMPTGIVYNEAGMFDVQLIVSNAFGDDTLLMTEYIEVRPVGINQNAETSMEVYPNPVHSLLTIQLDNTLVYSIHLLTMEGQLVAENPGFTKTTTMDVSGLKSGVYLLQVKSLSTSEIFTKKILIQ